MFWDRGILLHKLLSTEMHKFNSIAVDDRVIAVEQNLVNSITKKTIVGSMDQCGCVFRLIRIAVHVAADTNPVVVDDCWLAEPDDDGAAG